MQCAHLQIGVPGNRSYCGAVLVSSDNWKATEHFKSCQMLAVAYFFNDQTFAHVPCRKTTAEQTAEAESESLPSCCNVPGACGPTKPTGFSRSELAFKVYEILMPTTCFYAVGTRESHVICCAVCRYIHYFVSGLRCSHALSRLATIRDRVDYVVARFQVVAQVSLGS